MWGGGVGVEGGGGVSVSYVCGWGGCRRMLEIESGCVPSAFCPQTIK